MSALIRNLNEPLNLISQLFDADASMPLRIFTDLIKPDGTILDTLELTYTSKGIFVDTAELMPNESVLIAKHYVYKPDGVTLHPGYAVSENIFELEERVNVRGVDVAVIKVKSGPVVKINTSNGGTIIKDISRTNVKILVSDDDTEIKTDSENVNIGV